MTTIQSAMAYALTYERLAHQRSWSDATFGPGPRTAAVVDHIRKELVEVLESPVDLSEWADVIILALDGATRAAVADGRSVHDVIMAVLYKQAANERREWPDWRTCDPEKAIEHVRGPNLGPAVTVEGKVDGWFEGWPDEARASARDHA